MAIDIELNGIFGDGKSFITVDDAYEESAKSSTYHGYYVVADLGSTFTAMRLSENETTINLMPSEAIFLGQALISAAKRAAENGKADVSTHEIAEIQELLKPVGVSPVHHEGCTEIHTLGETPCKR